MSDVRQGDPPRTAGFGSDDQQTRAETGFVSDRSRKRMTRLAWLLAVVAFVLQICLPVVLFVVAIVVMIGELFAMPIGYVPGAALHDGKLWYALPLSPQKNRDRDNSAAERADEVESDRGTATRWRLMSADVHGEEGVLGGRSAQAVVEFELGTTVFHRPRMVSAGGELWIVGRQSVGTYRDGQVDQRQAQVPLDRDPRPFAHQGRLAVVTRERGSGDGEQLSLQVWGGGHWAKARTLPAELPEETSIREIQAVSEAGMLHVFVGTFDDTVLHHAFGEGSTGGWSAPLSDADDWSAALVAGTPTVFRLVERESRLDRPDEDEYTVAIVGAARDGQTWREILDHTIGRGSDITALVEEDGALLLVTPGLFSGVALRRFQDGRIAAEGEITGAFPFSSSVTLLVASQLLPLLLSLLLGVVLTNAMRRHRVLEYRYEGNAVAYASLLRRGLAEAVDALLYASVPFLILWQQIVEAPETVSEPFVVFVFVLWCLPVMLLLSYLEGRWGRTPGKWLLGIRVVGLDLQPCGFYRALVRNLLLIIDGMFHYLVGILIVALSRHWQRLGDRSANTVVIRGPSGPAKPGCSFPGNKHHDAV